MHHDDALTEARIVRFMRERLTPALLRRSAPLDVTAWEVPGEPVPFETAVAADHRPFAVGDAWGRPWGTTWFHVTGTVPAGWDKPGTRIELLIDLGFSIAQPGFQAEGLVYDPSGRIVKALEPLNMHVPVQVGAGGVVDVWVEAASNPDVAGVWDFAPTPLGDPATAGTNPIYRLNRVDVVQLDVTVWELLQDCWTLDGLRRELGPEQPRRAELLRGLGRAVQEVDPDDVAGTAQLGRDVLAPLLAAPASASAHRIVAVGHAHIDSAWLWPVRETIRKCARTFSNVLDLMDHDPDFVFACSSAQQFAWMRDHYPELFERIRSRVAEGRFVPVGGMWVESDTNLPGGEAMARQFVAGKRFFLEEFGLDLTEVWLPDSFGYSAAMPQIVAAAGATDFLTQKVSWNETNRFPHHTFLWEGIDGTRVFTHFPPADTYNSALAATDLHRAQRQFQEKGESNVSLLPFGHGDGGGGPTREMLAAAVRTRSLEGSPTVEIGTPSAFFAAARADYPSPPVWSGELYLEFHRGTYTSQARTKRGNRRSEHLLREAELWAATAAIRTGAEYPYDALDEAWHTVLLQQFHDILPGSSIAWVHQVAEANYQAVAERLTALVDESLRALTAPGGGGPARFANASPFVVDGVPALGVAATTTAGRAVLSGRADGGFVLDNGLVRVTVDPDGRVTSVLDLAADREVVAPGAAAAELQVFRDTPNQWDAWDVDLADRTHWTVLDRADVVEVALETPGRVAVLVRRSFGSSSVTQTIALDAGRPTVDILTAVDWHERQKLLKLAFPVDVRADVASSEIQFGHVDRPTAVNTSWDAARFETAAHRWVHVGEPGYGLAVANDSTYGHDVTRTTREDGGTTTLVRQSLLRAPRFPDPTADQGEHVLRSTLTVGARILDAAAEGYRINLPLRPVQGAAVDPIVVVDRPGIVVEAVKLAEDRSGDLVVRLYEATGGRSAGRVSFGFPVRSVRRTDLLEREHGEQPRLAPDGSVELRLRPFEILTLRAARMQ
ncbi:alpha-mannosidase [Plantibacter sp. Leaf171]|uniref:alpha-mannosidase n=1 Tax=unclassified Plantibacter TaxID=2624265 RepID=UPI0006F25B9B|nr:MULTISPECIES: glycoside hydrolase family 38 C-terminal domain-containing protein [unclassified Plantibacter]KQM15791.1 alpha-mannosidase [Plantibacter sp. Leaf1]KQR58934.1 alpha-mannosidase [Plantibacter sp. Leaf171]